MMDMDEDGHCLKATFGDLTLSVPINATRLTTVVV
jgi:hypothetical protein